MARRSRPNYAATGTLGSTNVSYDPIRARCRRCRKESEFPHPNSKAVSEMKWAELVVTRTRENIEFARHFYQAQPRRVIAELLACSCGGPLQVIEE